MIKKSPYKYGDVKQGVVKKTPSISRLMGKYGPPATPKLPGTHCGDDITAFHSASNKHFWKDRTP